MIYLDNAATGGQKPDLVISAVNAAIQSCANPGRSGHALSLACANQVAACRRALHEYFDGYGEENVVFTKNCTEALNVALFGVLRQGDHVVTTVMEHNSVLRPLHVMQNLGYIRYDLCPLNDDGNLDVAALQKLVRPTTKMVVVTTASNVTGTVNDPAALRKYLPERVLLMCDGAQGAGHYPIKMQGAGIDLLCLAGHKGLMGIQGSGALIFSDRAAPTPLLHGGTGSVSYSLDMPDFYPDALEAGTLAYPAILSLLYGVQTLQTEEKKIFQKITALTEYCISGIKRLKNYRLYSRENPCGIVAFSHESLSSEIVADRLNEEFSIAVRGGFHCAPLMHEALDTTENGLVRASFSHFTSFAEVDALLVALEKIDNKKAPL